MKTKRRMYYHGTSKENADKILESGYFEQWTYFADNLADAIGYGGNYVFAVWFEPDEKNFTHSDWQFRCKENKSVKDIGYFTRYEREVLMDNVTQNHPDG